MEQPRNRRDFNSTIVCSAFPQKLTEVAQKFYRAIRAIISSVYPAIVRLSRGTIPSLRLSQLLFIRSIYEIVISFEVVSRGISPIFLFFFSFFSENISRWFIYIKKKKGRKEKKRSRRPEKSLLSSRRFVDFFDRGLPPSSFPLRHSFIAILIRAVSFISEVDGGNRQFVVNIYWCLFERGTKEGFIGIECKG